MYYITTATKKIKKLKKRIRIIQGGTGASKTVSIMIYLIALAQHDKEPTLTSVVSESFPHLRRGAMRDFTMIMQAHDYWKDENWNRSEFSYEFETGSQIEFFSADQADKLRGARRDRCFLNEANNVSFDAFEQLEVRTKEFIIIDYNPTAEFWAFTELNNRDDVERIILTYKDNEALDKNVIASIEQRRDRKGWWKVYGEGILAEIEGKIYKDWAIIDQIPHEARLERRGLDFGYTNDPSCLVDVYKHNEGFIIDEQLYQRGMDNRAIADFILNLEEPQILIIADSAEPKSIDEIKSYGINVLGAKKGRDSVRQGIQFVQAQRVSLTSRSINLIKEYRNYLWMTDRDGKVLNIPEKGFNHGMDAIRYAFDTYQDLTPILKKQQFQFEINRYKQRSNK